MRWLLILLLLPTVAADVRLVAVTPDLSGPGPGDEGFAIHGEGNYSTQGLVVDDGESSWALPSLALTGTAWFVGNASLWHAHDGPAPVAEFGGALRLGNDGDDLRLLRDGVELDAFLYGDKTTPEWGELDYASPNAVFRRWGGDTDTAEDWRTPRIHRIGQSQWPPATFEVDAITAFTAPDSIYGVLSGLIEGATERLHLHVYALRHQALADALADAAARGVDVRVMVEDSPIGMDKQERDQTADALRRIQAAGGHAYLAGSERYRFHHLKVLVADDAVVVQTENWVQSGVSESRTYGNRGWGVVLHDVEAADHVAAVLAADRSAYDVEPFVLEAFAPLFSAPPRFATPEGSYVPRFPAVRYDGPFTVRLVLSPDHTGYPEEDPVAAVVRGAQRVDAQQLDFTIGAANDLGWHGTDPFFAAMKDKGTAGRILVAAPFRAADTGNQEALQAAGIPGCTFSRDGLTLHAKGIVADDTVVVGSMNMNHHSRSNNREVTLIIDGASVATHFREVIADDWNCDLRLPMPGAPVHTLFGIAIVFWLLRRC